MSYIALYRKYRPNTFEGIVGQENVTKILKNQVNSGKISHAYIFSGSRGTGKTSAAKVFARAINCLNPINGEPCNECSVCKSILEGNTTDVIEMDAASNNSVENIRQIRQEVVYATIDVKYRVYIIDEAHMLTTSAFNALLKTLEEPPQNVVFILATTEQHKIPVTILSRCLRFEFGRISDEYIVERLKYVLEKENIKYEDEAIEYIAKLSEGGLRDALSILDRCMSENFEILDSDKVEKIVGAIDRKVVSEIVKNINELDSISAIKNVDSIIEKGKDLRQFVSQITEEFLNKLIKENLDKTEKDRIINIIDKFSKLDNDLRLTSKPNIVLKAAIVEICNIGNNLVTVSNSQNQILNYDENNSVLLKKIAMIEQEIEKLSNRINTSSQTKNYVAPVSQTSTNKNENINEEELAKKLKLDKFNDLETFKKYIVESGKLKVYSALAGAQVFISHETIFIITNNSFAYNILRMEDSINVIGRVFEEKYNQSKIIRIELSEKNESVINKLEQLFSEKNVEYTKID
jgi:DNA polymerase-3 subunit gamma/tau